MRVTLYAPEQYWRLDPEVKAAMTNGCGTGGWKSAVIPDTLWFLSIREACDIHDYMYRIGTTLEDKAEADRVFLNNMLRLIEQGSKFMAPLRRRRALKYYEAVHCFGGPAFWSGKNPDSSAGTVDVSSRAFKNRIILGGD